MGDCGLTQGAVDLIEEFPRVLLVGVYLRPCNCIAIVHQSPVCEITCSTQFRYEKYFGK